MPSRRQFLAATAASAALGANAVGASSNNVVSLRTHEWFGDTLEKFEFPQDWHITTYHSRGHLAPVLSRDEILKSIQNPVGTKPLREIAAGKKTVTIAVDDLSRPTPSADVIPHVVAELNAAGIKDENILFIMAHGSHYQMNRMEVAKKIGAEAVRRHPWMNHNAWENHVDLGKTKDGNQIFINTYYYNADVKIAISGLKRHGTPGYGGGPKLIVPGVTGIKTIRYMHYTVKQAKRPDRDRNGVPIFHIYENEQREDMIEASRLVGVDFSVQQCYNEDRNLVKVVSGDIVKAHHEACRFAVPNKSTEFAKNADIVIANCYPKGLQLHEHFGWASPSSGVKEGGSVVLINQNPMGEWVWHYNDQMEFFDSLGGDYFKARAGKKRRFPHLGQLLIYSQYLQAEELSVPSTPLEAIGCRTWTDVIARLKKKHTGSDVQVAVYPAAGIQHEVATHDIPDGA